MTMPAKQEHMASMIGFIKKAVENHGGNQKDIYQIHLISEEIILNIIKYAYPEAPGDIEIAYEFYQKAGAGDDFRNKMMIRITDQGIPFNPLEKDEPDISLPVDERNIGGLGIFMVRNLVDDLSYHRDDHQNILTIIKQLHE